jgi:hypothetical protein
MSSVGGPIQTSLVQAAQAQQVASKARDKEKARTDATQRRDDQLELRVTGVEATDAVRKLPHNDSEQAEEEHRGDVLDGPPATPDDDPPRIDVKA